MDYCLLWRAHVMSMSGRDSIMALLVLKILLVVIALTQGLGKFLAFFLVKKETRMKMVEAMYAKGSSEGRATRLYDHLALVFMFVLIGLL